MELAGMGKGRGRAAARVKGLPVLGVLPEIRRDPAAFFQRTLREEGDRVRLRVLGKEVLLLGHPEDLHEVLVNDRDSYGRSQELRHLRPVFGDGLLTSEGELWKRQRRLLQPKFSRAEMEGYAEIMVTAAEERADRWAARGMLPVQTEMMGFTRDVVCRSLFGAEGTAASRAVGEAVDTVFGDLRAEILFLPVWRRLPLRRSRQWNRAVAVLDGTIRGLIRERRAQGGAAEGGRTLLDVLLEAQDADGEGMSDEQVRDEVLTMFLGGHETSAVLMTWAMALLAKHPEMQERVAAEAMAVAAGGTVPARAVGDLRLTAAVVQEVLRLYPPVWSLGRTAERATTVGDEPVAPGMQVWMCVYAMQRDQRWWAEAETFQPDRWMGEERRVKGAFLPFGRGPRMCIGQHFAQMEAVLGLAAMARRFRWRMEEAMPEVSAWITLRPKTRFRVEMERRATA